MESILIPATDQLRKNVKQQVDMFCTLSESLFLYKKEIKTGITAIGRDVLQRAVKIDHTNWVTTQLFDTLKESVLTLVHDSYMRDNDGVEPTTTKRKVFNITAKTMDKYSKRALMEDCNELQENVSKHQKVYRKLQEGLETYWYTNGKVKETEILLETAKTSKETLPANYSTAKLKARDKSIQNMTKVLKIQQEKADAAAMNYFNLLNLEQDLRENMKQVGDKTYEVVIDRISKRLSSGLNHLKNVLTECLPQQRSDELVKKLQSFDIRTMSKTLLMNNCSLYSFPPPREYHHENGFDKRLPDGIVCRGPKAIMISYSDYGTNLVSTGLYLKSKCQPFSEEFDSINFDSGFLNLKPDMTIKRKLSLVDANIAFGWGRCKKWSKKSWGFFTFDDVKAFCSKM